MMPNSVPSQLFLRTWLLWFAGTLAFPIAGLAGTAVAGPGALICFKLQVPGIASIRSPESWPSGRRFRN